MGHYGVPPNSKDFCPCGNSSTMPRFVQSGRIRLHDHVWGLREVCAGAVTANFDYQQRPINWFACRILAWRRHCAPGLGLIRFLPAFVQSNDPIARVDRLGVVVAFRIDQAVVTEQQQILGIVK